jgi:hypothetical protein
MGFEPAIFGLTGRHVNHYTTPPIARHTIPQHAPFVKSVVSICGLSSIRDPSLCTADPLPPVAWPVVVHRRGALMYVQSVGDTIAARFCS